MKTRPVCPTRVLDLFHRRWTLPLLVELHRGQGARFVVLAHTLPAGRASLRQTIGFSSDHGWVKANPGYGHPLRPEYLLTSEGTRIARIGGSILESLARLEITELGLQKWSMPVLRVLASGGVRYHELRTALPGVSDRALAIALKRLCAAGIVRRRVIDDTPPSVMYEPARRAAGLCSALASL